MKLSTESKQLETRKSKQFHERCLERTHFPRAARRGVLTSLVVLGLLAISGFNANTAQQPPEIDDALPCGRSGSAGGVAAGTGLFRVDVNLADFPDAICNDGSGAVFFVRQYSGQENRNKWQIHLQGGGGCSGGQSCAARWCSRDTNFGADKMSTSLKPPPPGIRGAGVLNPNPQKNNFARWNHAFIYYCSSDQWSGTVSNVQLSALGPMGNQIDYRIHFQGANILDAVMQTLQRQPNDQPVQYRDDEGVTLEMPDLDEATHVLFAGSSAGGGGVRNNADRLHQALRRQNVNCQSAGDCPLVFRAAMDAAYDPAFEDRDYLNSMLCPPFCNYTDFMQDQWNTRFQGTWGALVDESCVDWHATNDPGTKWQCADSIHTVHNHITTPFFVTMDQQDNLLRRNFVETGFGTDDGFGQIVHDQLVNLPNLDSFAEEGSVLSGGPPLETPGTFGPQCEDHEKFRNNQAFFDVKVLDNGVSYSFHDVLWNWFNGLQPQQIIEPYTGPGPLASCR